ncbi:MAG: hypothetical protein H6Q69_136 [Firmicutes bacterium]|nr:hypothetical protein [Bacillota bacterium]MBP2657104.1 hypothetical protein [Bacillota bacterium]
MITIWNDVSFSNRLSYRNTILTYNLGDSKLNLLCDSVRRLRNRQLKVFVAENYTDIYTVPYFIGFLNFAELQDHEKQVFFEWWKECSGQPIVIDGELSDSQVPLTYIFNCDNPAEEMPNIVLISDILESKDKLEQMLLQEIKNLETENE